MISPAKTFSTMETDGGTNYTATTKVPPTVSQNGTMHTGPVVSTLLSVNIPPVLTTGAFSERSKYLLRNLYIQISNVNGETFTFKNCKIDVSGQKYIGIQQDMFTVTLKNINLQAFAAAVNNGFIYIRVVVDNNVVFSGSIKSITTARENVVERTMTLNCLMKVTDLLSDMVSPITVNSSMNVWHVLNQIDPYLTVEIPQEIRDLKFDDIYTLTGQKKNVVDDIVKILNNMLNRMNMKDLPWLDYELRQDGTLSLFGPTNIVEVLNVQPWTGLTDPPTVADVEVQFSSIYKYKLVPGRVVKLDNALFATSGTDSAFVYAFDENSMYVITDVAYSFSNYPWAFKVSCKARPLGKYQNWVVR